jgi:hypothetical protein
VAVAVVVLVDERVGDLRVAEPAYAREVDAVLLEPVEVVPHVHADERPPVRLDLVPDIRQDVIKGKIRPRLVSDGQVVRRTVLDREADASDEVPAAVPPHARPQLLQVRIAGLDVDRDALGVGPGR